MEKLMIVIRRFLEFRESERKKMEDACTAEGTHYCGKQLGDVVTVNLTYLEGTKPH